MSKRGRYRGRPVNGVLLLDKPQGETSNASLQRVKRMFKAAKAGHTGSLDPLATGMLPICLGEATKFSQFLLESDKHYRVEAKLGEKTETGDADGQVIAERPVPELSKAEIESVLERFRGAIEQVPSMYSAIKYNGEPLYKLARQGIEVERPARQVTIYALKLLEHQGERLVLDVVCSKGTYVRSLVEDIGEQLQCGAHVAELRRLQAGPYKAEAMVTFDYLNHVLEEQGLAGLDALLLPVASAVSDWPEVVLGDHTAYYLQQGQPVQVPKAPTSGWVKISLQQDQHHRFLGVGEIIDDGRVAPRRMVVG